MLSNSLSFFAYLKNCLLALFFSSWVKLMRSASVCLVTGQETQLISKQEVKIAEKALLLSTRNLWIVFTLAQGQSGVEILKNSGDKQEVGAWIKTLDLLISPQLFWNGLTLQNVRKYNLILLLLGHNRQNSANVWVWTGVGGGIQSTGNCSLRDLEHNRETLLWEIHI